MSELETTSKAEEFTEELSDGALDRAERPGLSTPGICQPGCFADDVSDEF